MGCLHLDEVTHPSLSWYTSFSICPLFPKMGTYWDKSMSVNFLCSQGMSCCDIYDHDLNRSLPFFGKLEWIRPLLLKLLVACSTKAAAVAFCLPPPHYAARGTLALGARAATIDQVGSFKRVIVYGASAPRRALPDGGSLFKLVHVQHCFNLGN